MHLHIFLRFERKKEGGVGIVFVDPVGPVLVEKPWLGFTRI